MLVKRSKGYDFNTILATQLNYGPENIITFNVVVTNKTNIAMDLTSLV